MFTVVVRWSVLVIRRGDVVDQSGGQANGTEKWNTEQQRKTVRNRKTEAVEGAKRTHRQ